MTEHEKLASEYFLLFMLMQRLDRLLRDIGYDVCGGDCGGTCPLCVARKRFAPRKRPRIVLNTIEV